jgi:hypothetical protein
VRGTESETNEVRARTAGPKMWVRRKGPGTLTGVIGGERERKSQAPGNKYVSIAHRGIGQLSCRGNGAEWPEVCMILEC